MRKLIAHIIGFLLSISYVSSVSGDLFEDSRDKAFETYNDYSRSDKSFSYSGGIRAFPNKSSGGDMLRFQLDAERRGCSALDLAGNIKAMFNQEALESFAKGLAGTAIAAAPLVLMCYASQQLCDAYKHFKAMTNMMLTLRNAQCAQLEEGAMNIGMMLQHKGLYECINQKVSTGMDLNLAMDKCRSEKNIKDPWGGFTEGEIDLIDKALKHAGASPATENIAKLLIGDMRYSGAGRAGATKIGMNAVENLHADLKEDYAKNLNSLMDRYLKGENISIDDIKKVSTPEWQVTVEILKTLHMMDSATRTVVIDHISTIQSIIKLQYKIIEVHNILEAEESNPRLSKGEIAELERKRKRLLNQYNFLIEKAKIQKELIAPLFERLIKYNPDVRLPVLSDEQIGGIFFKSRDIKRR